MNKKKHHVIGILVSALFFTVFIYDFDLMNGVDTAKTFYFFAISGIIIIFFSISSFFRKSKQSAGLNFIDLFITFFYIYVFIRYLLTNYANADNLQFITCCLLILFYWIIRIHANDEGKIELIKKTMTVFLVAGIIQALICLLQIYGLVPSFNPFFRMTGSFGNPDALAGYLTSIIPFAFGYYLFTAKKNNIQKQTATIFLVLSILVMPSTMIRNGWIAMSAGIIYILIHKYKGKVKDILGNKLVTMIAAFALFAVTTLLLFTLYSLKPDSIHGRFLIWKVSKRMVIENPIWGIGFSRFGAEYGHYQAEYFANHPGNVYEKYLAGNVNHAHNDYLEILCELGLAGLLCFFLILYSLLTAKNKQKQDPVLISAKASLISMAVFMMGSFPLHILPTSINVFYLVGIVSCFKEKCITIKMSHFIVKPVCVIMLVGGIWLLSKTADKYFIYKKWQSAVDLSLRERYEEADDCFQDLYTHLKYNGQFLLNYGGLLSLKGNHQKAIELLNEAKKRYADPNIYISLGNSYAEIENIDMAEKSYWQAYHMIPNRIYPLYLLTKMYHKNHMPSKSREMGMMVLRFIEKVPNPAVEEIKTEIRKLLNSQFSYE